MTMNQQALRHELVNNSNLVFLHRAATGNNDFEEALLQGNLKKLEDYYLQLRETRTHLNSAREIYISLLGYACDYTLNPLDGWDPDHVSGMVDQMYDRLYCLRCGQNYRYHDHLGGCGDCHAWQSVEAFEEEDQEKILLREKINKKENMLRRMESAVARLKEEVKELKKQL